MSVELLVKYRRDGESYSGAIYTYGELQEEFDGCTFAEKMRLVHLTLLQLKDVRVLFQRTDREGLLPVELEPNMVDLLRTDPARYISAHTVAHRVVDLRKDSERVSKLAERYEVPKHGAIRAGHDTLAAAFGEFTYLRFRAQRLEHPVTGRWCSLHEFETLQVPIAEMAVSEDGRGWAVVRTEDLLNAQEGSIAGYYLPRDWNKKGPWISREALLSMFEQYKKDKQSCLEAIATT